MRRSSSGRIAVAAVFVLAAACGDASRSTAPPSPGDASTRDTVAATGAAVVHHPGVWSAPIAWPIVPVHLTMLPNGKVMGWSSDDDHSAEHTDEIFVWDPTGGAFTRVPNANTDIYCSAHAFLPDGRLMVNGGHIADQYGSREANVYDFRTNTWTPVASMRAGRWYPTSISLASGEVVTVAGTDESAVYNQYPEVWTGSEWRLLGSAPRHMIYYPWIHVAPDGRVFNAGPDDATAFLDVAGSGAWQGGPRSTRYREKGTSVVYGPGKVLILGGDDPPTNTAETIDLNAGTGWRSTGSMQYARRHVNAVVLADGTVLAVGGSSGAGFNNEAAGVLPAELWNPMTGSWTTLASMRHPRVYHAATVLLPDGRVLVAGGGRYGDNTDFPNGEIFTPPYLLKADGSPAVRPTITSAPASVGYAQTFPISTPDAAGIARVTLARLSSTTHSFDMNQRFVELAFTGASDGVSVTMPASANHAPPGHYLLFILNGDGVPSVARIVQLSGSATPQPSSPPAAPGNLSASAVSASQIGLTWSDESSNEQGFHVERCQGAGCTSFAQIATLGAGATSYQSTGLSAGTTYGYRVRAFNDAGTSGYSSTASATTTTASSGAPMLLVSRHSGTCLDVAGGSQAPGTPLIVWTCHGGAPQRASLPAAGTTGEVRFYDGTMCLDAGASGTNGTQLTIASCSGVASQRWTLTGGGLLQGINGKCADLEAWGTAPGTRVLLWDCHGGANQQWDVRQDPPAPPPPSGAVLLVNEHSGLCLDVAGDNRNPGTQLILWNCHGGAPQRWTLPANNGPGNIAVYDATGRLCLDDAGGRGENGDAIATWTCHSEAPQQWTLTPEGLLKGINGKCVDADAWGTAPGTRLILWDCHGGANQRWRIRQE